MSMAVTAITVQGAGAVMGAFGARSAAQGQKTALAYKADIAEINAQMDERQAQSELLTAQRQESRVLLKGAQTKASQRVAMAANGIDLGGSDTAVRQLASTEFMRQSDALIIDSNAVQKAEALRMKEVNDMNDARMSRAAADAISPSMAFTSSLIQGVGSVASNWYMMNKLGAFGDTGGSGVKKLDYSWDTSSSGLRLTPSGGSVGLRASGW